MRELVFVALLIAFALPATAQDNAFDGIFVAANKKRLCGDNPSGKPVDKDNLANLVMEKAAIPLAALYRANPTGTPTKSISPESVRFAIVSPTPFGPGAYEGEADAAAKALNRYRGDFINVDRKKAEREGYKFPAVEYLGANTYFHPHGPDIYCTAAGTVPSKGGAEGKKDPLLSNVLVRKTVDDLTKTMQKSGFATLAYEQKKKGERVVSSEGVLGIKVVDIPFPEAVSNVTFIPFVKYSSSHAGKATDKEYLQPGLVFKSFVDLDFVTFTIGALGSQTFDLEHDARRTDYGLTAYPVINLGSRGPLLGAPLPPVGALFFTPEILLKAGGSVIGEAGTNAEYQKARSFHSYGAVLSLYFGFYPHLLPPYAGFLNGLSGTLSYHMINNTGGVVDVRYRDIQISYALPGSENWSVVLEQKKGIDPVTLAQQDYWRMGVGYRY